MNAQEPSPALLQQWQQFQQASQQNNRDITDRMAQAAALVQDGRADEACALYREALDASAAFERAWSKMWESPDASPFEADWRLQTTEHEATLEAALGTAQQHAGRMDEARATFETALTRLGGQSSPIRPSLLQSLGGVCQLQGAFDEAEDYLQRAHREFAAMAEGLSKQPGAETLVESLWTEAARSLSYAATNALSRGDGAGFLSRMDEALRFAQDHRLADTFRELWLQKAGFRLDSDPTGETLRDVEEDLARLKTLAQDGGLQSEALRMIAGYWRRRGVLGMARTKLQQACDRAETFPGKKWMALQELATVCEQQGDLPEAIRCSEEALGIARRVGPPFLVGGTLLTLIPRRMRTHDASQREQAKREMDALRASGSDKDIVGVLLLCAVQACEEGQFDLAWRFLEEAQPHATTPEMQFNVLLGRVGTLRGMGRKEEALQMTRDALASLPSQSLLPLTEWQMLLGSVEALHENAAFLAAELGRGREAFEWAENGRALRLSRRMTGPEPPSPVTFDQARDWLTAESAALAVFCLTGRGTLVLIADPQEPEPQCFFSDLTDKELLDLLPTDQVSEQGNEAYIKALPRLSEALGTALEVVAVHCETLYVMPDSRLYLVPFAALTLGDGKHLIERCALAYAPSFAVLRECRSRPKPTARTCLALGVGTAESSEAARPFSFGQQVHLLLGGRSWAQIEWLLEGSATASRFLERAPLFTLLHLSAHGEVKAGAESALSASSLLLADRRLSAKEVFDHSDPLQAELVFLNACLSGRFQSRLGGEVGGFWEAFLHAGAASLIATLTYVSPGHAHRLAHRFYDEWLRGDVTKAEALRRAQLAMHRQGIKPRHWASHILIGDAR